MYTQNQPFALIEKDGIVTHYSGEIQRLHSLEELKKLSQSRVEEIIFMNPFRTIRERGYEAHGDESILALVVSEKFSFSKDEILTSLADMKNPELSDFSPSISDADYMSRVTEIQKNEIAGWNICQMIFSRSLTAHLASDPIEAAFATYRNLLTQKGQYMTFLFSDGSENIFVSATPEEHLGIRGDTVSMMPIAGTMRKWDLWDLKDRLRLFLTDTKEINELAQVLDEELKMMEHICDQWGRIEWPFLRQNGAVIHTEYRLIWTKKSGAHPIDLLRETLHAPTLTGGPIQSAASRIAQYEWESRGYYGGEIGILKPDGDLDTAISIRMAHFIGNSVRVRSGAGIVRDSTPEWELREVGIKAQGIISAIHGTITETPDVRDIVSDPEILELLRDRNKDLSRFHFESQWTRESIPELIGKKAVIIDNEDNFSSMIARMMRVMGMEVEVIPTADFSSLNHLPDIVILGPGPGDIGDPLDTKMQLLREHTRVMLGKKQKVLGICLGHQAIAGALGYEIWRLETPMQGIQEKISIAQMDGRGREVRLGFYNSFIPYPRNAGWKKTPLFHMTGKDVSSFQFHPESVMSQYGYDILTDRLMYMLSDAE